MHGEVYFNSLLDKRSSFMPIAMLSVRPLTKWLGVIAAAATVIANATPVVHIPVDIQEAIQLQETLDSRSASPAPSGMQYFELLPGCIPVIITAPHSTMPFREGHLRFSDGGGTASLAKALHESTGATVLFTVFASPSDANFYDDNEFKRALSRAIYEKRPILLLDIHGSAPTRPYDIDLGTINGRSLLAHDGLLDDLIDTLQQGGMSQISTNFFSAGRNSTVTKFASERGVPSIQLEINSNWLIHGHDESAAHRFEVLVQILTSYIRALAPVQGRGLHDGATYCQ